MTFSRELRLYQHRVWNWINVCFDRTVATDKNERNHRFLEEALELVQAGGCTKDEAHMLVEYVYGREVGEIGQEVGGVMNTLAALCNAHDIHLGDEADREMNRVEQSEIIEKIRRKHAAKPKSSALPGCGKIPLDPEIKKTLTHVTADLRHMYQHLMDGTFERKGLANGLLSPQIKRIEKIID